MFSSTFRNFYLFDVIESVYSTAPEIFKYFNDFAKKYGLEKYIKTEHAVSHAEWDERAAKWNVKVKDARTGSIIDDQCDILINATGTL